MALDTYFDQSDTRAVPVAAESKAAGVQLPAGSETEPARGPIRAALRAIVGGLSVGMLVLVLGLGVLVVGIPALIGGTPLTILTGSMTPTLPPGTLVVVGPTPADEVGIGDVLTFQLESGKPTLVTHRVVGRSTDSRSGELRFITRGDANETTDAVPVMPVQVKGTVWYAVPWLGWVNQAVNGEARAWVVPAIAAALFAYAMWMVGGGIRDRYRNRHQPVASELRDEPGLRRHRR